MKEKLWRYISCSFHLSKCLYVIQTLPNLMHTYMQGYFCFSTGSPHCLTSLLPSSPLISSYCWCRDENQCWVYHLHMTEVGFWNLQAEGVRWRMWGVQDNIPCKGIQNSLASSSDQEQVLLTAFSYEEITQHVHRRLLRIFIAKKHIALRGWRLLATPHIPSFLPSIVTECLLYDKYCARF